MRILLVFILVMFLGGCTNDDISGDYYSEDYPDLVGTVKKINDSNYKFDLVYYDRMFSKERRFTGEGIVNNLKIKKDGIEMGFIDDQGNIHIASNLFIKKK